MTRNLSFKCPYKGPDVRVTIAPDRVYIHQEENVEERDGALRLPVPLCKDRILLPKVLQTITPAII